MDLYFDSYWILILNSHSELPRFHSELFIPNFFFISPSNSPTAAQQVLATPDILRIIFARDDEEADHEPELGLTDRDLLNCATVNSAWTHEAILVLWREPQLTLNEVFEDIPPARRQIYANFVRSGFMESWSYEYPTDERNHTIA